MAIQSIKEAFPCAVEDLIAGKLYTLDQVDRAIMQYKSNNIQNGYLINHGIYPVDMLVLLENMSNSFNINYSVV